LRAQGLNGIDIGNKTLTVRRAQPKSASLL